MTNMAPKTTQDRVQVGTKIEKNGFPFIHEDNFSEVKQT